MGRIRIPVSIKPRLQQAGLLQASNNTDTRNASMHMGYSRMLGRSPECSRKKKPLEAAFFLSARRCELTHRDDAIDHVAVRGDLRPIQLSIVGPHPATERIWVFFMQKRGQRIEILTFTGRGLSA